MADRFRSWLSRLSSSTKRRRLDREFEEELETHAALLTDEHARRGLDPGEARRRARVALGGVAQLRESHHDQRGLPLIDRFAQDVRFAVRMFAKAPGFTLFAAAALALGIGATTAVFTVAYTVLIRPLPYRDPSRLVMVWQDDTAYGFPSNNPTPWTYSEWRSRSHVFDDMAAVSRGSLNLIGQGEPENLRAETVSPSFFRVLGVDAPAGRTFADGDGQPGAPLTAVLSYSLWQRRFGGDPATIGRTIDLSDAAYTVVGVMPRGFQFVDADVDVWTPTQWTGQFIQANNTAHFLTIAARLHPGVTIAQANADMSAVGREIASTGYAFGDAAGVVVPLHEQLVGGTDDVLVMLFGAVAFLLLIACANVANLLLARGSTRRREMAVRLALGASRRRVVEQMLVESVLLSAAAGAAGVWIASAARTLLIHIIPPGFASQPAGAFDLAVLAFAAVVSVGTGVAFGLLPALRCSQVRLASSLREGSPQTGGAGQRLRAALVVAEVAVAVILLSGATLMIRSFEMLVRQDPGFRAERVLTMRTPLPRPKYADPVRRRAFYRDVMEHVAALPGVTAAGYTTFLPLASAAGGALVTVENRPVDPKHFLIANVRAVTPDYFHAVGMTLRRGRLLRPADNADSLKVIVVNDMLARTYWPGEDPIGRRLKVGVASAQAPWVTVAGVVADMRQGGLDVPIRPEAYFPVDQFDSFAPDSLAIRTSGDPSPLADLVRQQVWAVDKDQPIVAISTLDQIVSNSTLPVRVQTSMLGGFAAMALLLAALGIYAVLSFAVTQRIREIGVRVALGARPSDVLRMIAAHGLKLFGAGMVIGLAAALALSRLMTHLLFGIAPTDPLSYALVTGALLTVTLVACYVPARRATTIDPLRALRWE
jgi:putative ABC transport system permease protein